MWKWNGGNAGRNKGDGRAYGYIRSTSYEVVHTYLHTYQTEQRWWRGRGGCDVFSFFLNIFIPIPCHSGETVTGRPEGGREHQVSKRSIRPAADFVSLSGLLSVPLLASCYKACKAAYAGPLSSLSRHSPPFPWPLSSPCLSLSLHVSLSLSPCLSIRDSLFSPRPDESSGRGPSPSALSHRLITPSFCAADRCRGTAWSVG